MAQLEEKIVEHLFSADFDRLTPGAVTAGKRLIIDSLGGAIAGWHAEGCQDIVKQVKDWGGKPEASILVDLGKVPAPTAAFMNGVLAHSRDFDDDYEPAGIHCSASVVPAALAAAELVQDCTGKEFLTAVILGVDIMCRLGDSMKTAYGWHQTAIFGAVGATAAVSKILRLNKKQMQNAFGIEHCSIPGGNKQGRKEGALTKRLQPAYAAQCGVMAAVLARRGITGCENFITGEFGFWNLYSNQNNKTEPEKAEQIFLKNLGNSYKIEEISLKPYPCCRFTHPAIDGALQINEEYNFKSHEIKKINIKVSEACYERVGSPFRIRTNPQVDAQFSIPYTVALALINNQVSMADLENGIITSRNNIQEFAERVKVTVDPTLKDKTPICMEIETEDKTVKKIINAMLGSPEKPLSEIEAKRKFKDCLLYSGEYREGKIEKIYQNLQNIGNISSIQELIQSLNRADM